MKGLPEEVFMVPLEEESTAEELSAANKGKILEYLYY
jgi:hypothetical protein